MGLKQLDELLRPRSIAVIGASNQEQRPGNIVMRNLLQGGFDGPIMPVTPNYKSVCGVLAYRSIDELPLVPDLAIVCTRAMRVPAILLQLGRKGARTVIVIAAGLETLYTAQGTNLLELMEAQAKTWNLRVLGPNSLGLLVPRIGLNASYAQAQALPGKIAVISQSTSVCVTLLDWAKRRQIGFSYVVDLGEGRDINFDEMLDFMGRDPHTSAILLYVDAVRDGRRFVSAARAASLNKPVLVIKTGRHHETQVLLDAASGGPIGKDEVYDAIFKRAGMLRVGDLRELLAAVETLANGKPIKGEHLVIVSNGNAPSAMVLDVLMERGGRLHTLPESVTAQLHQLIRKGGRATNPINLLGDASPEDYQQVLSLLLREQVADNILVLHSPSALIPAEVFAKAVIDVVKASGRTSTNVFVSWMGEDAAVASRQAFAKAGIASFRTPEGAAGAFMHTVQFRRNQKLLSETPDSMVEAIAYKPIRARELIEAARTQGRMSRADASEVLGAYGISHVPSVHAPSIEALDSAAHELGFPLALKLNVPQDLPVKADLGSVVLNLHSVQDVLEAAKQSVAHVNETYPGFAVQGFTLQSMAKRSGAHQLRIEVQTDAVFGPVILLGDVASHWNAPSHAVAGVLPLNMALARYLVIQALAEQKIRERDTTSSINRHALETLLVQVSQLVIDNPEIISLSINPVLMSKDEARVLDAQIELNFDEARVPLAIKPYPKEWEEVTDLKTGERVTIRPLRAEDEIRLQLFDQSQTKEDRYKRYFGEMPQFTHEQMARMSQLDYDREMAFILVREQSPEDFAILGIVRIQQDPENIHAEFAMAIRSDLKGMGIGTKLLQKMIDYTRSCGTQYLVGFTMLENAGMANLARKLGFQVRFNRDDEMIEMKFDLQK